MQALVFTAAGKVELLDMPEPDPLDGETVVRVRASSVCGSELHGFRSVGMRVPPLIMGHEFVGTIPSGERVVVNPLLSCGHCDSCLRSLPQVCRSRGLIGVSRAGGFAERVAVPTASLHVLPNEVSWSAATLIEPLANAVHAWSLIEPKFERIGVIGAGPIGLVCSLVARARGAEVVVSETSASRRAVADKLGFTVVEGLDGEFDAVIDAVGLDVTRRASVERCRPAGTAVWLGLAAADVHLEGNSMVRMEKRVVGSFAYTSDEFAEAVAMAPLLDLSWTTDVPLSRAVEVFYALAERRSDIVKAVLVPAGEVSS